LDARSTYRQLITLLLLAVFLTQTFSKLFIIVDYYTDTAKYALSCENIAKPTLHCDGKCQMMKKLKEKDKKEQKNPQHKLDSQKEITLSSRSYFPIIPSLIHQVEPSKVYAPYVDGYFLACIFDIFHPPRA